MKRITRAHVNMVLAASGRPTMDSHIADIYFAARKAGLNDHEAHSLACCAYDAQHGYVENLSRSAKWLRQSVLNRKAADTNHPQSLWAYAKAKLGAGYIYATDEQLNDISVNDYAGWSAWADAQRKVAA